MNVSIVFPFVVGWLVAQLVNYLSDVLPATRKLSPATCSQCGAPLVWTDYLIMKKCSSCGKARSLRNWLTLLFGIAISANTWYAPPTKLGYWLGMLLVIYLGTVLIIDLEHRLILHPTSIAGAILATGLGVYMHGLQSTLLGGAFGYGLMLFFYGFGILFTKLRAKRMHAQGMDVDDEEALGFGDVNLAGILGLLLGWPLIWIGLLLGILGGGLFSLLLVLFVAIRQRYQENALMIFIPYGPYFIISAFLLLYLPHWISSLPF